MSEPFEYLPEKDHDSQSPVLEHGERRSGLDRRQFSFGYAGPERRSGIERRKGWRAAD